MKTIKILGILLLLFIGKIYAQEPSADITNAIVKDDAKTLNKLITKENINSCYGSYSALAHAIRLNAKNCFDLLIAKGADVNLSCNGYVQPLMHAAKYGRLEMVKVLVAKGADPEKKYEGTLYPPAIGKNPIEYAQANGQTAIVDYLKSLKK